MASRRVRERLNDCRGSHDRFYLCWIESDQSPASVLVVVACRCMSQSIDGGGSVLRRG